MYKKPIVIDGAYASLFNEFVDYKRGLGYVYPLTTVALIRGFSRCLVQFQECPQVLTREMVDVFCQQRVGESSVSRSKRISISRQFALYLQSVGIDCYVPAERNENVTSDFVPYIISEDEMARILARADKMPPFPRSSKSNLIYSMLLRMLWCCGLRLGEALSLTVGDINLNDAVITIRKAKYNQTRVIPMSESLAEYVRGYWQNMGFVNENSKALFFPNPNGNRRDGGAVTAHVKKLMRDAGVTLDGTHTPRVHDIRHSFAVAVLKKMQTDGVDIYSGLPLLSMYMGHSDINSTEYYLRVTEADFACIESTMSDCYEGIFPEVA